jgi:hypothetical protein
MISCPKCKGGCNLCQGTGQVPEGVANIYNREEMRATAKMPASRIERILFPEEDPTKPAVIRKAERRVQIIRLILLAALALALGVGITLIIRTV